MQIPQQAKSQAGIKLQGTSIINTNPREKLRGFFYIHLYIDVKAAEKIFLKTY